MSHDYPQGWLTDLANRMARTHDAEPQLLAFQASAQAWMEKALDLTERVEELERTLRWVQTELELNPREAYQCVPGIAVVLMTEPTP